MKLQIFALGTALALLAACEKTSPECAALQDYDACAAEAADANALADCQILHLPDELDAVGNLNLYHAMGAGGIDSRMRDIQEASADRADACSP